MLTKPDWPVLPLYYWPPVNWLQMAAAHRVFGVAYPSHLERGSLYYRCYIPLHGWMTIPLLRATRKAPWQATWPSKTNWKRYHYRVLQTLYGKAPFFLEWKPFLEVLYLSGCEETLSAFSFRIIQELASWHGWKVSARQDAIPTLPMAHEGAPVSSIDVVLRFGLAPSTL
jgi:hypothetical protein